MDFKITDSTKKYLLGEARSTISDFLGVSFVNEGVLYDGGEAEIKCGAFVTLHKNGALRGCVGMMQAAGSLTETVREMAEAAAFEDGRFRPVAAEELAHIDIEITLLSPMTPVSPEGVVVGRDGLYMEYSGRRGVLLPQVPAGQGWDREQFLNGLCLKAGVPPDTWREKNITLFRFEGIIFSELDFIAK